MFKITLKYLTGLAGIDATLTRTMDFSTNTDYLGVKLEDLIYQMTEAYTYFDKNKEKYCTLFDIEMLEDAKKLNTLATFARVKVFKVKRMITKIKFITKLVETAMNSIGIILPN